MKAPPHVMKNLSELQEDHRVKFAAWDHPEYEFDEDGEVDEGCYYAYLLPGWSIKRGEDYDHLLHAFSLPEMWVRMKNVEPCLCDECFQMPIK